MLEDMRTRIELATENIHEEGSRSQPVTTGQLYLEPGQRIAREDNMLD